MAANSQGKVKRKKTPAERNAKFEAIGERYRLAHASDDGTIRVDGPLVAARERDDIVQKALRTGMDKRAGIDRAKWTDLGPDKIGGRGRALIIDPADANRMWFGAATGGIWATTDGGASWSPVNDYLANLAVSHMALDTTNPNIMYAASGEPFASGVSGNGAFRGVGIFKSTDRGATWNLLEATRPANESSPWLYVNRIAVNPGNGSHVWAATRDGGLWQSIDGGTNWTRKALPSEGTACDGNPCAMTDIVFHPANGQQLVVAAATRIYSSSNGGQTFTLTPLTDALAARTPGATARVSLAAAPSVPGKFVASVNHAEPDTGTPPSTDLGQVWGTTDGGASWTWLATPRHLGGQGDYDNAIWVDPTDANVVIAAGIDVWRSVDGGTSFMKISDWAGPREFQAHADHHLIVHHPGYNGTTNRIVYVTNDGGIQRAADIRTVNTATDATSGWSRLNTKLRITQFYTITSRLVGGKLQVLGGTQDNGNPLLRPTGTTDWEDITGGDGAGVGIDSRDPRRLYTAYIYSTPQSGIDGVSFQSRICTTAQIPGGCADGTGTVPGGAKSNFIAPMILDPNNSDRLLTGTNDVLLSKNPTAAAPSWEVIKTGFPVDDGNYVANIEVAIGNSDVIMVGHNRGQLFRTTRGTQTDVLNSWTQVNTAAMPQRYNTSISIDPRNSSRAWATFGGFERSNVWFTADGGTTWTNIHANLPQQPIYRVRPHPTKDGWLYAATESGVYTSEDSGATWTTADDGPANVIVHDMMFVSDSTLVIGTHGRGAWRIDSLAAPASRLVNIATRAPVFTGDNVMIGGFIISGTSPKKVLVTARGPSMAAQGVPGVLPNPMLTLYSGATPIASNDDWGSNANAAEITATGFGPKEAAESALLMTLNPGAYTAIVTGASGSTGIGIVEAFEVDKPESPLINIATRAPVLTGDSVMIGGFIIQGDAPKTVLVRARGPSLAALGVPGVLADPAMTLYAGATVIAGNDNWETNTNADAIRATGTAPTDPKESALLMTLNPGGYTVIVTGAGGSTGIGIVEVFAQ